MSVFGNVTGVLDEADNFNYYKRLYPKQNKYISPFCQNFFYRLYAISTGRENALQYNTILILHLSTSKIEHLWTNLVINDFIITYEKNLILYQY